MPKLYTIEDLDHLDGDYELDRGRLIPMSPGGSGHGFVCIKVGGALDAYVSPRRLGRVYGNDTGFVLQRDPDTLRGPDVAFVRAGPAAAGFVKGAPDLAVEVVGESGDRAEAKRKAKQYLAAGAALVWVLDLERRDADVYTPDGRVRRVSEDDVLDGADVLPGFRLPLRDLYGEL